MRQLTGKAATSGTWYRIGTFAAFAVASLVVSGAAVAQQRTDAVPMQTSIMREDGVSVPLPTRRSGFNLFAEEDLAGTSLRLTGSYRYVLINAGGLCPFANTAGDIFNTQCGSGVFFHATPVWGIGLDDYRKIRDVWPAVASMRAPLGFSTPWRITSIAPITMRINAADGQFGQFYGGTTSLDGAGCRDMTGASGGGLPANFTLLAASNCPETWAGTGFGGLRELPDSVWLQRFQANPAAFRWDDWQIPASAYTDKFLGNLTTYGAFSDYNREMLQLYGGVTPKGKAGDPPGERGFPLGIYVRADAWKFDRPSLREGAFVRWIVVNNSEKVWGTGIDYDNLHMGVDPGYILGGQSPGAYNIPSRGVHLAGMGNASGRCNNTTYPRRRPPGANDGCEGGTSQHMIMFLKSPIGDMRNKFFSDPTSPFYFPTHPEADDTITFNQWRKGGFGAQEQFSWRRSDRALYGLLSGDEDLWLDGRNFADFSAANIWNFFRYEFTDGTQSAANVRYNRSVPGDVPGYGKWDYNEDGIQDTLKVPACGSQGCSGLYGDTIAGGFANQEAGNIGNYLGVGPFSLKAGDTTEFIFYMGRPSTGTNDTLATNRMMAAVQTAYFKNYAGASAYPTPSFTAADVQLNSAWFRDSINGNQNTEIRIQIKMPPRKDDDFLKTVVARLQANEPVANNLRNLNPQLLTLVQGRMRQNLAQVLVFKSCDNGVSWTNDGGCTAATAAFRTRDQNGNDIGLGWRPLQTINVDSITGVLSSYIVSETVNSGREYLYSFVTKTRGLFDIKVVTSLVTNATGGIVSQTISDLGQVLGVDIDTIVSSLSSNGPHTVKAYAPLSVPAGTIYARLDTTRGQQPMVTNRIVTNARTAGTDGNFRMRFGNRFILTRTDDTVTGALTTTVVRQSIYARGATSPGAAAFTANFVAAADTFTSNHGITYQSPAANALRTTPRTTVGSLKTFVDTIAAPGYVIGRGTGGTNPYYLSIGTSFIAFTQGTGEYESTPYFPGFTATVNGETAPPNVRAAFVLRHQREPKTDTMDTGVQGANGVVYQVSTTTTLAGPSGLKSSPGGFYRITWGGDAHGPGAPFSWDVAADFQPVFSASLAQRPTVTTGDTTAAVRTLISAGANNIAGRPLVAARFPFSIRGPFGGTAKLVMVQRHQNGAADSAVRNSRLYGTNGDTTRLSVPVDMWMPGDTVYIVEKIITDSTATVAGQVTTIHRDTTVGGRVQQLPIQVEREVYGAYMPLGCSSNVNPTRTTCNPIRLGTRGSSGYLTYENGFESVIHLNRPFDQNSEMAIDAQPTRTSVLPLTKLDLDRIQVVPNPFIVQSSFDQLSTGRAVINSQVRFVNVPEEGTVRIYSISGQLMQQLSWTRSDLVAAVNGSQHGDLPYNLRSREGLDLSSGLYLWVMTAKGDQANAPCTHPDTGGPVIDARTQERLSCENVARGKFVVIR